MAKFEAWFADEATVGMKGNRIEVVEADGYRAAHAAASKLLREGEFVRGVVKLDEEEGGG